MIKIRNETRSIPTYQVGPKEKNPMFFEKRVYQGSSGKVYPFPVIEKIEHEKHNQNHRLVVLENDYLCIWVMPDLGGRIYRAIDKTNAYDFVYYNEVIKPALVGLTGPWISGGIEFNWPQHHRPSTYEPVRYHLETSEHYVRIYIYEIDRMYGTSANVSYTLYDDHAYLEISGTLFNRTDTPQSFLWWANPAVVANEHTQSIFPPDVTAVYDHGKRDVSAFPIARGTYYKVDYSAGVDISRYQNIPVCGSFMAYRSEYDFMGGYDYSAAAGILHVADHHIAPGKKQWTWGNGEFGQRWDDNLTDTNGPYVELMTGIFTDNQPDFTWLAAHESKQFVQYFMPYKKIGVVKNATKDLAIGIEPVEAGFLATLYASKTSSRLTLTFQGENEPESQVKIDCLLATTSFQYRFASTNRAKSVYRIAITDESGEVLLDYVNRPVTEVIPEPANAAVRPEEVRSNDELFMIATHLDQYRHATFDSLDYLREGLKRDPGDVRINTMVARKLIDQGKSEAAYPHIEKAIERLWMKNERALDSEPVFLKGLLLQAQGKLDQAQTCFHQASWSVAQRSVSMFRLGLIQLTKHHHALMDKKPSDAKRYAVEAIRYFEESLVYNGRDERSKSALATALRLAEDKNRALATLNELRSQNPLLPAAIYEMICGGYDDSSETEWTSLLKNNVTDLLELTGEYAEMGQWHSVIDILERSIRLNSTISPLVYYHLAEAKYQMGDIKAAQAMIALGEQADSYLCFPNKNSTRRALELVVAQDPDAAMAHYYLGLIDYDRRRYDRAIALWEQTAKRLPTFPTVHRNLGIAYYNKQKEDEKAMRSYQKAFSANPFDSRVLYEFDQLRKRMRFPLQERLEMLESHSSLIEDRDDLYLEYVTLLNSQNRPDAALQKILARTFHVWEGGEGLVARQYVLARLAIAQSHLKNHQPEAALIELEAARLWPKSLGEGRLTGIQENHVDYWMGMAYRMLKNETKAIHHFGKATMGLTEVKSQIYYNDQPADTIFFQGLAWMELGNTKQANACFEKLQTYADTHRNQHIEVDFFAVSLPNFMIFEDDLDYRNNVYCRYLEVLAAIGRNDRVAAVKQIAELLAIAPDFQGLYFIREVTI
jgi:tetratricopeptide (TPR) repeat protein